MFISNNRAIYRKKIRRRNPRRIETRWYRAPEIIFLEPKPSTITAADVWSIGAIFAELLMMQRCNRPDPTKRGPIFPGDTCFGLSMEDPFDYASRVDQIQVMFDIIGSPDESEIEKITDEKARKYLRNLPLKRKKNLKRLFPGSDKHALDLFSQLLRFDVDKRMTIDEALEHPYFAPVMDLFDEKKGDNDGGLEHELEFEEKNFIEDKARVLILKEVLKYNENEKKRFILSGGFGEEKVDIVLCGYIRNYIQPFVTDIPSDLVNMCFAFLFPKIKQKEQRKDDSD